MSTLEIAGVAIAAVGGLDVAAGYALMRTNRIPGPVGLALMGSGVIFALAGGGLWIWAAA